MSEKKGHYVLVENEDYKDYLMLVPLKKYLDDNDGKKNTVMLGKELEGKGLKKIELSNNYVYLKGINNEG